MNKKALGIALVLFTLLAVGVVFAQVCLTNDAANVIPNGRTISVRNKMNNQSINVEIFYTGKKGISSSGSIETGAIEAFKTTTVTIPQNTTYSSYTVWTCY